MKLINLLLPLLFLVGCSSQPNKILLTKENSYILRGVIDEQSVNAAIVEITKLHYNLGENDEPIYLSLMTPGGSIIHGNILINHLKSLGRPIHTITIFAASMGFVTVQSLGDRLAVPSAIFMAHPGSTSCSGNMYEIQSCLALLMGLDKDLQKVCADRIGMDFDKYNELVRHEYWVTASKAIEDNVADKIVQIECDKALMESKTKAYERTMFGPMEVEFSSCPTMLEPVKLNDK